MTQMDCHWSPRKFITTTDSSSIMAMYDSTTEFNLNRAMENIKLAQQVFKRELEKKDEIILALQKRIEFLQLEGREYSDFKRIHEKQNRELLSSSQFLKHELSMEQSENDRLKEEINGLREEILARDDKIVHLESEQDKANHIIKNLLRKIQGKRPIVTPKPI